MIRTLHLKEGKSQSTLRPQTPDDHLQEVNSDKPQATSEDETSSPEIPSGRGIQAWSTNAH